MSPQYCGKKHLHVLHETLIRGLQTGNSTIRSPGHWTLPRGFHTSAFAWRQSQRLHDAEVLLVSTFTPVASEIPGNVPQHAGSAACKYATKSGLMHPPAAGFGRIGDKKEDNCSKMSRWYWLQRQTCERCAQHAETLIQRASRPKWFFGGAESQRQQDLPQSPITAAATSIHAILITSPQSRPAAAAQTNKLLNSFLPGLFFYAKRCNIAREPHLLCKTDWTLKSTS